MNKEIEFNIDEHALTVLQTTELTANFAEIKAWLKEHLNPFTTMIVTEDAIKEAKEYRARCNKVLKAIDDRRKLVKKLASKNIIDFEEKCKELTDLCKEASENIGRQIKALEEEEREAKIDALKEYFENATKEYPEYICFNDIVKPEWSTKAFSIEKAHLEIDLAIKQSDIDVQTIMAINKKWTPYLLNEYKETHDLRKVLAINNKYCQIEAEQEKQMQEYKEEKEQHKEPIGKNKPKVVPESVEIRHEYVEEQVAEKLTVTFTVTATERGLNALQAFMDERGIMWEVAH